MGRCRRGCWSSQHAGLKVSLGQKAAPSSLCCLQSKCLVQTRSSIGKQEKKSNKIMLLGAGSWELLWLCRAELGGKAANERKPSTVEEAGMSSSLVQYASIFCSDHGRD